MLARPTMWDPQYRDLSGSELLRQVDRDKMLYDLTNTNRNDNYDDTYTTPSIISKKNYYKANVDDFIRDDELEYKPTSRKQEIKNEYAELKYTQDILRGRLHSELSMWLIVSHLGLMLLLGMMCALEKLDFITSALIFGASALFSILYVIIRKNLIISRVQNIDSELADLRTELHQINAKNKKSREASRKKKIQKAREEFVDNQVSML